jgi:cytochrome c oxidase subunit II
MAIKSPEHPLWWRERVERTEVVWIAIAFAWGLIMFSTMIAWHVYGKQNLANEAYRVQPEAYVAKVEAAAEKYKVGEEGDSGVPVVHPPPGGDVYLLGRIWQWWPVLELEKGQTYRLHLSSAEWQHGFSLQPVNINIQVHPGYEMILTMAPSEAGEYGIVCNEFCGIGHHTMTGKIRVVEKGVK